jgi:CBS-domain-containing membrane protein
MHASDIMTTDVATVPPDMSVQQVARLMAHKGISGVPVVSPEQGVLGMVSEADLLRRAELGTDPVPARWTDMYTKPAEMAREFAKSHGTKAHDIMAKPVVSVQHDAELRAVADTLDQHGIKRVPVMKDGKLAGIIARSDLVRAFGKMSPAAAGGVHLSDGIVHKTITDAMRDKVWLDTSYMNITVNEGLVRVAGFVHSKDHQDAIRILIEEIPGVERVEETLEIGMPTLSWDGQLMRDHILT